MNTNSKKNVVLEYIWIDVSGKTRSKNKVITIEVDEKLILEEWTFDGSSTGQAFGTVSDVVLNPVSIFKNTFIKYPAFSFSVLLNLGNPSNKLILTSSSGNLG